MTKTANTERLRAALDDRGKLSAAYRRAKKAQFERAYEAEPRLRSFAAEIRHCGMGDAEWTIAYVRTANHWLRDTDPETRALAIEIVSTRIRQIREKAGLPPFDDALPGEEPDVFQIVKGILVSLSVKKLLAEYAASQDRLFDHDRSNTIGASEVGQCMRKSWFSKNDTPQDEGYIDRYGARLRGNLIEDHHVVPGLRASLPPGVALYMAGNEQRTIVDGYISATPDGVLSGLHRDCLAHLGIPDIGPSRCLAIEIKSIDPRADLRGVARSHHTFQVQVQMGLLRAHTKFKPDFALIVYLDASFLDEVTEFVIPFDPAVYAAGQARSEAIMAATDPLEMTPEGKISGGAECRYCPWASHCAQVVVAGIPKDDGVKLGDNALAELKALRDAEYDLSMQANDVGREHAAIRQQIKEALRTHRVRRAQGDGWEISWSTTKGRETVDIKAAEASGLDLSPWRKVGEPGDRLVVK